MLVRRVLEEIPDPAAYPLNRLFCLDLVRGLDIVYLTTFHALCVAVCKFFCIPDAEASWFEHQLTAFATSAAPLYGFNVHDFAQPLFIFICGAAVPFAIPKRLTSDGCPTTAFWKHVFGRFFLLWFCGILLHRPYLFDPHVCRPFSDTLQTIALAYLGAALAQLIRMRWVRLAVAFAVIGLVGVVHATYGDYSCLGNIARRIDIRVFTAIGCISKNFCYILTIPVWLTMGIFGAEAGDILKSGFGSGKKVIALACWGLALVAFGCLLRQFFGIPYIRYMYMASFTFVTLGMSFLLTDAVFVVTDVWRFRRGTGLLLLFGQNSLSAWMISHFFGDELYGFSCRMTAGLPRLLGTDSFQKLFVAIVWAVAVIASVLIWKCVKKAWRGV